MATGYLHAQFESTPGNETNTPTLSTKAIYLPLRSFQPSLGPSPLERDDELRGVDEPISVLPETYSPSAELDVRAYPDVTAFLLKAILGAPTTTAGNGVITDPDGTAIPTGAYRHVWTAPYGPSGASPQTCQLQPSYADESVYYKVKGWAPTSVDIESPEEGGVGVKAQGPACYIVRQSSPGLTASYESLSVAPFLRANLSLQTDLSGAASADQFSVNISNPNEVVRTLGSASRFPDVIEKGAGPIVVSGSVQRRHLDTDDWDALLNATAFTIKARWRSTVVIASSYYYSMWLENNNAQYLGGGPDALVNSRRQGSSFEWKATYGGTAGSSKFTVVNATTSYA